MNSTMNFRAATLADVDNLAAARWAFRTEDGTEVPIEPEQAFLQRYRAFVRDALESQRLVYWLAETADVELVAHMAVCIVQSIPRPSRVRDQWGYLTDCYTRPAYRSRGIGEELLTHIVAWARRRDLEMLVVWPSDRSRSFYARAGFGADDEVRVLRLRDYDAQPDPDQLPHAAHATDGRGRRA
jgi:GNAT superfamily N-acetyltransferase